MAFSVWVGDVHLFAPGGFRLGDGGTALRWAAGYSRSVPVDVTVCDGAVAIATFRRGARIDRAPLEPPVPAADELRVRDARPVRQRSGPR